MRVVLADDSVLLREGIARLLEDAGFEVVGQAGDADELLLKVALAHARTSRSSTSACRRRTPTRACARRRRSASSIPDVGVLVLSQYVESGYALELLVGAAPRASATCSRTASPTSSEFAAAVRRVAEGGSALDPEVVARLVGRRRRDDPLAELTPREREVLELMAEGRSNQAIAERLVVTRARRREARDEHLRASCDLPPATEDHRRVLAVLAYLRQ